MAITLSTVSFWGVSGFAGRGDEPLQGVGGRSWKGGTAHGGDSIISGRGGQTVEPPHELLHNIPHAKRARQRQKRTQHWKVLTRGPRACEARHPAVGILQKSAKVDFLKVDSSKDYTFEDCRQTVTHNRKTWGHALR